MTDPTQTLDQLRAQLAGQAKDIEHLQRVMADLADRATTSGEDLDGGDLDGDEVPTLMFDTLERFVSHFVEGHYERPSHSDGAVKWFPCWPSHPSATWVMEILWGSFEEARAADLEGGGGSNSAHWMIGTFIPLMEWVTAHDGAMGLCSARGCDGASRLGETRTYPTAAAFA